MADGQFDRERIGIGVWPVKGAQGLMQALLPSPGLRVSLHSGTPHPAPLSLAAAVGYARGGSGYARGGVPPRGTGFSGAGELGLTEEPDGPDLVLGPVTGYRWWTLAAPYFDRDPLTADDHWPRALLHGQMAEWQPGLNLAECLLAGGSPHDPGEVPLLACSCGHWAYWAPQEHQLTRPGTIRVFGVIRGSGKVLIGDEGFRAAKARLLAVHLPFALAVTREAVRRVPRPPDLAGSLARAGFTGKVYDWSARGRQDPEDELEAYRRDVTPAEDPEGYARAEAWMAVIGDRIEQAYPGVRVFETRDALLKLFPPDARYAPQPELPASEAARP